MEKEVMIRIKGSHTIEGQTRTATMTTMGTLTLDDEGYELRYHEWGLSGTPGPLSIRVTDQSITMEHADDAHINLVLPRNGHAVNHYMTPRGPMSVDAQLNSIRSCVTEHSGELEMEYELRHGPFTSTFHMQVAFE